MKSVYCYRAGKADCFKIGRTKHDPDKRMRRFATGSPVKLQLHRAIQTEHAAFLEKHIHRLLALKRAENGEFFNVTVKEVDDAIEEAVRFVADCAPILLEADALSEKRPEGAMLDPTTDVLRIYRELRNAARGIASWESRDRWELDVTALRDDDEELYARLFEKYKRNSGSRSLRLEKGDLAQMTEV